MGRSEIAAYESEVDKSCSKWVVEVAKELKRCVDAIQKQNEALTKQIERVRIPQGLDEKELKEIPKRINKILRDDDDRIRKVVDLELHVEVDVKKKKLEPIGWDMSGEIMHLIH